MTVSLTLVAFTAPRSVALADGKYLRIVNHRLLPEGAAMPKSTGLECSRADLAQWTSPSGSSHHSAVEMEGRRSAKPRLHSQLLARQLPEFFFDMQAFKDCPPAPRAWSSANHNMSLTGSVSSNEAKITLAHNMQLVYISDTRTSRHRAG